MKTIDMTAAEMADWMSDDAAKIYTARMSVMARAKVIADECGEDVEACDLDGFVIEVIYPTVHR